MTKNEPKTPVRLGKEREGPRLGRLIVLGYYDGPTSGVAEYVHGGGAAKIELLAWDLNQDIRIFSLSPLPSDAFQRLLSVLAPLGRPTGSVWMPPWKFDSDTTREAIEAEVESVLAQASSPTEVFASDGTFENIVRRKPVTYKNLLEVKDWFSFMGLSDTAT